MKTWKYTYYNYMIEEHEHVVVDIWFQFTNSNFKHLFFKFQFQISTCNLVLPLMH
jgi:hypothetical protein